MNDEQAQWQDWVGRTERRVDKVSDAPLAALAATLDRDDPPPREGDAIPEGWIMGAGNEALHAVLEVLPFERAVGDEAVHVCLQFVVFLFGVLVETLEISDQ